MHINKQEIKLSKNRIIVLHKNYMQSKTCLYSGETFSPKRRNQKFANSINRSNYHNEKAAFARHQKSFVEKKLIKNFKIVQDLLQNDNKLRISKNELLEMGFDLNYFTHMTTEDEQRAIGIYNVIIHYDSDKNFLIVKRFTND